MTKVAVVKTEPGKVAETPSQQIVGDAAKEYPIQDASGRTITLRKPGILAQYRLIETLGDSARNEVYVSMVMPILFVTAIDGNAVTALSKKSEVEALIQRLDEDGITAVVNGVKEHFGDPTDIEGSKLAIKK